jgi:endonuclease YncB( thermonuclease family)
MTRPVLVLGALASLFIGWSMASVVYGVPMEPPAWVFKHPELILQPVRETFSAQVVGVSDGDTIKVRRLGDVRWAATKSGAKVPVRDMEGPEIRVRLWGIDAPESGQPFGKAAKKHLSDFVFGQSVRLIVKDRDRYARTVAIVILPVDRQLAGTKPDEINVNEGMVREGYAWWYEKFAPKSDQLRQAQADAMRAKRGIWSEAKTAVPPWEWRKG